MSSAAESQSLVQKYMQKYMVVYPGQAIREFERGEDAVEYLRDHPGYAKLYAPNGYLLMTKGAPPLERE